MILLSPENRLNQLVEEICHSLSKHNCRFCYLDGSHIQVLYILKYPRSLCDINPLHFFRLGYQLNVVVPKAVLIGTPLLETSVVDEQLLLILGKKFEGPLVFVSVMLCLLVACIHSLSVVLVSPGAVETVTAEMVVLAIEVVMAFVVTMMALAVGVVVLKVVLAVVVLV